ncbi:hypothetical protein UFOVP124_37 [uncultured Caudovirales phage]|uniref:Uncharacterized protein n=1 Tax=uncultured Caudovirales phage TaxID=2100421 RepID=A0A6J5LBL2_9CAUD|nr:hypothetical protein UFOVP124_37 [uncultured Caudovirales phage]
MATIITGNPGERYTNNSGKVQYQLVVAFNNSCGFCIQRHHAIANYWPIPFHPRCNCRSVPVTPGSQAQPFVDFQAEIGKLSSARQSDVIGDGAWKLIQDGQIQWEDAVTKSRIKSLYEIAREQKLSVADMQKAGIPEHIAQKAYDKVNNPAATAQRTAQQAAYDKLKAMGYSHEDIIRLSTQYTASRIGLTGPPNMAGSWLVQPGTFSSNTPNAAPSPRTTVSTAPPTPAGPPAVVGNGRMNGFSKLYPASYAKVETTPETIHAATVILNKNVKPADLATLAGARATATVKVTTAEDQLTLTNEAGGIKDQRITISRDKKGKTVANLDAWDFSRGNEALDAFGYLVNTAMKLGIDRLTVTADGPDNGRNGYWSWPELGFDARLSQEQRNALQNTPGMPPESRNAKTVQGLIQTSAGANWWHANGSTINAHFDLTEGSRSVKRWQTVEQALNHARMMPRRKKAE